MCAFVGLQETSLPTMGEEETRAGRLVLDDELLERAGQEELWSDDWEAAGRPVHGIRAEPR